MERSEAAINKNRWIILAIVIISPFMATLDSSIVNVALPQMSKAMAVSMASIEWVVTSYLIAISATILVFGRLGDIKGKTAVFKWGFLIFTVGSLLCGISTNLPFLIFSRVVQAIGAAATMANSQGIITHVFPVNERGRALGISGTSVALGTMVGPPLGGFIVQYFRWHYIFLINVPIGIVAMIIALKFLPKGAEKDESIDFAGAILFGISILCLFYGIIEGQKRGYESGIIITSFIACILLFIAFIRLEKHLEHPLLDLSIFKNGLFSVSIFTAFLSFLAISSSNIIQPFYLQDVLNLSPAVTGLIMMVYPIILSIVAPVSGHLSDKIGSELLTFIGLSATIIGLLLMATLRVNTPIYILIIFIAFMAVGNGLFQSPNNSLVMSTVPKHKLGIAGSINALVRNLGMVTGVSIATTLLYTMMGLKLGYKVTGFVFGRSDAFVYGMKYVYLASALFCLIGNVLTALRLYNKKKNNAIS